MKKELINKIKEYLEQGLLTQDYAGDRPHCECCGTIKGNGHKQNCELNNILMEIDKVINEQ